MEPVAAALAAASAGADEKAAIRAAIVRMQAADRGEDDPLESDIAFHVAVLRDRRLDLEHLGARKWAKRDALFHVVFVEAMPGVPAEAGQGHVGHHGADTEGLARKANVERMPHEAAATIGGDQVADAHGFRARIADQLRGYAIRILFDDSHDTGIYSWDYLHTLGREQAKMGKEQAKMGEQQRQLSREVERKAEALIATASGLFAAIPAVLFYNHFTPRVKELSATMD